MTDFHINRLEYSLLGTEYKGAIEIRNYYGREHITQLIERIKKWSFDHNAEYEWLYRDENIGLSASEEQWRHPKLSNYYFVPKYIYFKNQEDAVMFKLSFDKNA